MFTIALLTRPQMNIWPACTVLLVEPACFRNNEETASSNLFQGRLLESSAQEAALSEFNGLVNLLKDKGVSTVVVKDRPENDTPDSLFPNNWFSTHEDGTLVLYPMLAPNRRRERRKEVLEAIETEGFLIRKVLDFSEEEQQGRFLEGTGSLVLDHANKVAYVSMSERSLPSLAERWAQAMGYTPVFFHSFHRKNGLDFPVYHTNVMLSVGKTLNVFCEASVRDQGERQKVKESLMNSGRPLLVISETQMNAFAGNMIELSDANGKSILFMSDGARNSLEPDQLKLIDSLISTAHVPLAVIETNGGGSLRCMIAEIFLPRR